MRVRPFGRARNASPSIGSGSASLARVVAGYLDTSPMARRIGVMMSVTTPKPKADASQRLQERENLRRKPA
jgi:hypothetical protein